MKLMFHSIFILFAWISLWLSGISIVWAQFETFTPTFSPTPIDFVVGTPEISTVWLKLSSHHVQSIHSPFGSNSGASTGTSSNSSGSMAPLSPSDSGPNADSSMSRHSSSSFENTPSSAPTSMRGNYNEGIQNYREKHFDQAIADLKKAVSMKSAAPQYYYAEAYAMLGVIYKFDRPNIPLARHYCELSLKTDPSTATAKKLIRELDADRTQVEEDYWSGIQSYEQGDTAQAVHFLNSAIAQQDPATPSFYYAESYKTLGLIYQSDLANPQKAREYYQAALKIEPRDKMVKEGLAKLSQ